MKNLIIRIVLFLFASITFISCKQEQEEMKNTTKITIGFDTAEKTIKEDAVEQTLQLKLSGKAPLPGIITLLLPQEVEKVFTTNPQTVNGRLQLPIKEGDLLTTFKIKPIDNSTKDGHTVSTITLEQLTYPFIANANKSIQITILDDEIPTDYKESLANFIPNEITLPETNTAGASFVIHLSEPAAIDGTIHVSVAAEKAIYITHFISQPAATNGIITLPVREGSRTIEFKVIPVSNSDITGELSIDFTITATTGSIQKGERLKQTLKISDDELNQKPKGYENTSGNTIIKKLFEYDENGRIAKVHRESYNPYYSKGTDTYFYNEQGKLTRINIYAGKDIHFTWQNGRIIKSETLVNDILNEYTEYEYDIQGNIAGTSTHHRQQDGSFTQGFTSIYFYFPDGNIYKSQTYMPGSNPAEPILVSTRTYEGYMNRDNPFPMVEILPTVTAQTKLATSYRVEESGIDQVYTLSYQFRPDGLPEKRIATSTRDSQTVVYHYY
jgi:hypothetical protein